MLLRTIKHSYNISCYICTFQCFKKEIEARLFSHPSFGTDIKRAISDVVAVIERNLLMDYSIDTNFSGTTLVLAVIRGHSITIANIGDSRITLGRKSDIARDRTPAMRNTAANPLQAIPLSVDHKPSIQKEKERILRTGGRVFADATTLSPRQRGDEFAGTFRGARTIDGEQDSHDEASFEPESYLRAAASGPSRTARSL